MSTDLQRAINNKILVLIIFDTVLIVFHILVLQEYWNLMESRTPLKPVLEGVRIVARSISSLGQTQ